MPPCEGGYKNFKIGELFEIPQGGEKISKKDAVTDGVIPIYSSDTANNGIVGYCNNIPHWRVSDTTPHYLIFGDHTRAFHIATSDFCVADNVKVHIPKYAEMNIRVLLYLIAVWHKGIPNIGYARHWSLAKDVNLSLPTTSTGDIDFAFMESRIRELEEERMSELEEERMRELEAYLAAAGFANCDLTPAEQGALRKFNDQQVNFQQYTIGDLFEKLANNTKRKFNKRNDVSSVKSDTFNIPLVNAKHGDNGIMFYGKDSVFHSTEMTIDIVQNGAVATGDVYAQPQPTGVLWDAYLIKNKVYNDTESTLLYFATSISKSIKPKYCYDKKATWERVQKDLITLPTTPDGKIDYAFMETYISAIKKQTIAALKDFITREHTAYEQVINA